MSAAETRRRKQRQQQALKFAISKGMLRAPMPTQKIKWEYIPEKIKQCIMEAYNAQPQ